MISCQRGAVSDPITDHGPRAFLFAASRLRVRPTARNEISTVRRAAEATIAEDRTRAGKPELRKRPHTRGLPPTARPIANDLVPSSSRLRGFAASRLRVRPTARNAPATVQRAADAPNAEDRTRAGKPELRKSPTPVGSRPRLANTDH